MLSLLPQQIYGDGSWFGFPKSPCNETQNGFEIQWPIPSLIDFGFEILGSLLFFLCLFGLHVSPKFGEEQSYMRWIETRTDGC